MENQIVRKVNGFCEIYGKKKSLISLSWEPRLLDSFPPSPPWKVNPLSTVLYYLSIFLMRNLEANPQSSC
jgi:hypothetical protein